jgi:DNA-binding SARP family transcriptional activator
MTPRRATSVLEGLLTLVLTLLLLIGVPIGLVLFVGWPLPTSMPTADALSRAMQIGISDQFVVNTLAVIVWLAWAQLVLAMGSQTLAAVRGRSRVHVPVLPGMQAFAARLVTGILLLIGPLQPARAGAAPMPVPVVADAHPAMEVVDEDVIDLRPQTPAWWANGERPVVAESGETVTVERHDSYWAIAERTLGDGLRWREIHDLNVGRTMADGHVIALGDDTLRAGWQLAVPSDASVRQPMMATQSSSVEAGKDGEAEEVVVEAGDNLWYMAEEQLVDDLERPPAPAEVAPYWSEVIEANQDRFVEPGNPSLILPGQVLVMPATSHAAPPPPVETPAPIDPTPPVESGPEPEPEPTTTAPATTTPTTTPSTTEVPASGTSPSPGEDEGVSEPSDGAAESHASADGSDTEDESASLPVAIAVGGLSSIALAVGAKRLLNKRRRQYANDHAGHAPPPSDPEQRDLHHAVVAMADEVQVDDLQLVLGSLAVELAEAGSPRRPRVVRHSTETLEVLLDKPDLEPPAGWTAEGAGLVWTLDGEVDLDEEAGGSMCPAPLLVTIGQPDDDAQIYLDLEVDGVVSLAGDIEVARDLARSMLTELALAPLADTLQVIVIGDLVEPDASHLDHIQMVETWDDIAEDLIFWAGESSGALQENGWANTFLARGSEPDHDALVPIAVIATKPPPPELLAALLETRPSAVAIVVADEFEGAAASICCTAEALTIDDIDLSFVPQQVDADELQAMARLLVFDDSPAHPPQGGQADPAASEVGDDDHTQENEQIDAAETVDASERSEPPEYEVLVRLLGDIRIDGGTKQLNAKPTAVAAYLAIHRELTADRLEEACWFGSDGTSHRKLLLDAVSECRAALGRTHFPSNRHGTYRVDAAIRTDVELFEWHVGQAARQEGAEAMESYRSALDLVTGRPFTYPNASRRSFGWVDYEHHATTWEHKVTNVAKAFTELCLDIGRHEEAIDQLRLLLQAIPLSGDLVAALMRTHLATGDRAAAEALYQEHAKALDLAGLGDPDESVERIMADCIEQTQM